MSVDCTATIVSSTFEVMDSQGAVMSQVDFGALHYGDNKQVSFSVLNNGPKPARFFAACGTPQQLAEETDATTPRDDPMTAFIQVCSLLHVPSSSGAGKRFNCCYYYCCCCCCHCFYFQQCYYYVASWQLLIWHTLLTCCQGVS